MSVGPIVTTQIPNSQPAATGVAPTPPAPASGAAFAQSTPIYQNLSFTSGLDGTRPPQGLQDISVIVAELEAALSDVSDEARKNHLQTVSSGIRSIFGALQAANEEAAKARQELTNKKAQRDELRTKRSADIALRDSLANQAVGLSAQIGQLDMQIAAAQAANNLPLVAQLTAQRAGVQTQLNSTLAAKGVVDARIAGYDAQIATLDGQIATLEQQANNQAAYLAGVNAALQPLKVQATAFLQTGGDERLRNVAEDQNVALLLEDLYKIRDDFSVSMLETDEQRAKASTDRNKQADERVVLMIGVLASLIDALTTLRGFVNAPQSDPLTDSLGANSRVRLAV